uniref:Energy-coupling factor transporter transmembrane protein EcfT n=1 Tax=Bellilinea caldifistulae TaxID=360411 RepID=A0A7C4Q2T4_9CHLR
MHNFEFLRMVNIGQYLPLNSILHRLDARARIVMYLLILMAATFTAQPGGLLFALLVVLVLLRIGRIPLSFALRGLLPPLPFLLILAVLQVFVSIRPPSALPLFEFGIFKIYASGLVSAGMLLLRFCVLILALSLSSFTLSTSEMIHGLESLLTPFSRFGLPVHDLVMVLQVTIRFIPFLAIAAERIAKAQASRGAEWGVRKGKIFQRVRQVIPLIVPLFLTSLRRAETMALAMDARAYGSTRRRTSMYTMHFAWKDAAALLLGAGCASVILILGV